ncbi:MAG: cytochrome c-type biogenesis protein CcmH [Hyphomicrobiaceae bacterium]|nr:cytochrome c-type biogenesis protein CcmH [Hyphomicrobiaceae bacterium]
MFISPLGAVEPNELLKDPKLEARARHLSNGLRCLVCQNQSIDDSNAPLARDLRLLVRERLKAGDTDQQVMDYIVARYGEFVLLQPRFGWHTLVLWLTPLITLVLAIGLARSVMQRRSSHAGSAPDVLDHAERARLDALLSPPEPASPSAAGSDRPNPPGNAS